jgi:hypothetical protein
MREDLAEKARRLSALVGRGYPWPYVIGACVSAGGDFLAVYDDGEHPVAVPAVFEGTPVRTRPDCLPVIGPGDP